MDQDYRDIFLCQEGPERPHQVHGKFFTYCNLTRGKGEAGYVECANLLMRLEAPIGEDYYARGCGAGNHFVKIEPPKPVLDGFNKIEDLLYSSA